MTRVYELRELGDFLRRMHDGVRKASTRALLRTVSAAEVVSKRLATKIFKGTKARPKSGLLSNSIFSGFDVTETTGTSGRIANAFVAVRSRKGSDGTKPYGRIQEFGGKVIPKKAKYLWLPLVGPKSSGVLGRFKNITPSGFVDTMKKERSRGLGPGGGGVGYKARDKTTRRMFGRFVLKPTSKGMVAQFVPSGGGRGVRKAISLFLLLRETHIPANPYVGPAVEAEFPKFGDHLNRELKDLKIE